jgi:DNA-binding GntR family transcriptional regulator
MQQQIVSIKDKIYKTIKRRIINIEFKPGEILSDRRLAEELNVSRTPVRDALNLLQKENYVTQQAGRGFFVKEINLKDIEDMYHVREALEVSALKLTAANHSQSDIDKIEKLLKKHEKIIQNYKPKGKFLEDADFHKALAAISNNGHLMEILESIFERIQILKNIEPVKLERVKIAHGQHLQIFGHYFNREYQKAEEALSKHILDSKDDIIKRLQSQFTRLYF